MTKRKIEDVWKDSLVGSYIEKDYTYEQDLYTLIQQVNQANPANETPEVPKLIKELTRELKKAKNLFDELTQQKKFASNPLHFLYATSDDLDEMQDWCFENDLVFKIEVVEFLDTEIQAIIFKTEEDAMAFKLRWTD